jgi:hypothetical protein
VAETRALKIITPAKTYDLVTLAQVKAEIDLTKDDGGAWIQSAISQMSSLASNYCRRVFPIEVVQETILRGGHGWGRGSCDSSPQSIRLRRYPIVLVQSLVECGTSLTEGTDFLVDQESGLLTRLRGGNPTVWWASSLVITYAGGYATLASKTAAIPSPPQITVDTPASFELDCGVIDGSGKVFAAVPAGPLEGQYTFSADGQYTFNAADEGDSVTIKSAGTNIPGDIQRAMLRLMTMAFSGKGRDPMVKSRSQGQMSTEELWVGPLPGQDGPFPVEIARVLDRYRGPRFA